MGKDFFWDGHFPYKNQKKYRELPEKAETKFDRTLHLDARGVRRIGGFFHFSRQSGLAGRDQFFDKRV